MAHPYQSILFDLDGTLVDPREGITGCVKYALEKLGIAVEDADRLTPYIGPPLRASFKSIHGLSNEQAEAAVSLYRELYERKGILQNLPYPGARELLELLQRRGKRLFLATTKPAPYAWKIVQDFGMERLFTSVEGSEMDGSRSDKCELIAHVIHKHGLDRKAAVMVGDRMHDVAGASRNGMDSIAVGYGYGSREELLGARPTRFCASLAELRSFLAGE